MTEQELQQLNKQHPIILFDGVCNLCSGAVQFIIKRDPEHRFRFASLQSEIGQFYLKKYGFNPKELNSFFLIENDKFYTKSSAALRVGQYFGGFWKLTGIFFIVPPFLRNFVYNFIAQNRYRWFGKKDACWLPTPELRQLFLDQY